jgi:hypothetical protein
MEHEVVIDEVAKEMASSWSVGNGWHRQRAPNNNLNHLACLNLCATAHLHQTSLQRFQSNLVRFVIIVIAWAFGGNISVNFIHMPEN